LAGREAGNTIEQRLWPKLYPALLSSVITSFTDVVAVAMLSKILLAITALLLYAILLGVMPSLMALLLTMLFLTLIPIITVYSYVWSETLFIPLWLGMGFLGSKYLALKNAMCGEKIVLLILLMLVAIALFYTRYIGIIAFLLIPYVVIRKYESKDIALLIIVSLIYLASIAFVLIENYQITSHFGGGGRAASQKGVWHNVHDLLMLFKVLINVPVAYFAAIIPISLFVVFYGIKNIENKPNNFISQNLEIFLLMIAMYCFALVVLRSTTQFDDIDLRLLSPIFPMVWIVLCLLIFRLKACRYLGRVSSIAALALILALSLTGYKQILSSMNSWQSIGSPEYPLRENASYNNFTKSDIHNPIRALVRELLGEEGILISKNAQIFRYVFASPTYTLPRELTTEAINKLNQLPNGSLILLEKKDANIVQRLDRDYQFKYLDLGYVFAIALPLNKK
jgi:hypothetical protein